MNTDLRQWYTGLQPIERTKLKREFSDSPKAMLLIEFLEKSKTEIFRTTEAVRWVYRVENEDYAVLQNRYFKLRNKLMESVGVLP